MLLRVTVEHLDAPDLAAEAEVKVHELRASRSAAGAAATSAAPIAAAIREF